VSDHDRLAVGKIVKAFGVRGECIASPMTDSTTRFRRLKSVFVGRDAESATECRIATIAIEQRGVRIGFEGILDRTAAEGMVGQLLFVDSSQRVKLPKGRYFVHDIIGMRVVDEVRGPVGALVDVLKLPAHDVYVVEHEGRQFMIPAVKEFVRVIDSSSRTMHVRLIDGMMDEASGETVSED